MPLLLADFTHARPCKPFCEKYLTLPKLPNPKYIFKPTDLASAAVAAQGFPKMSEKMEAHRPGAFCAGTVGFPVFS